MSATKLPAAERGGDTPTPTSPEASPDERAPARKWVAMAKIGRPHGVNGELKVRPFNADSTLIFEVDELRLRQKGKPPRLVRLEGARQGGDQWIVAFEGVDDRDAASRLTHGELSVPREAMPPLEDGEFYHVDVLGAAVLDADSGDRLGVVRHLHSGASELLEIRLDTGGDVLVPLQPDYVTSIGEEAGVVRVRDLSHWQV